MYGGTPRCERCGGAVYHAEQVMGPGRKVYHKLCLKCEECGKRLDPGNLVQHENMPYCARCHTQLYGTRGIADSPDLRHANHLPTTSSPARSPAQRREAQDEHMPTTPTRAPAARAVPPPMDYYTPPDLSSPVAPALTSSQPPQPDSPAGAAVVADPATEWKRPNFRNERPIPAGVSAVAAAGGLSDRGLLRRTDSPRSKVGTRPDFEDRCAGCEKRVYAAEQVVAIGNKWHRGCLRCSSCRSTIDPSRVSDRDGQPWCKNCYAREHGPEGIAGKR